MDSAKDGIIAFAAHDHAHCCGNLLSQAVTLTEARGIRLTPVRRRTLEILLEAHKAIGAYDVLERLAHDGFGNQPPVAYRALEFLVRHGLAHRVRRLNAFAACTQPGSAHVPAFFICTSCDAVAEAPAGAVLAAMHRAAEEIGFRIDRLNVEAAGLCPACRSPAAEAQA